MPKTKTETKTTETKKAEHRKVLIPFKGKDYTGLVSSDNKLIGLIGSTIPGPTKDWNKAVEAALAK